MSRLRRVDAVTALVIARSLPNRIMKAPSVSPVSSASQTSTMVRASLSLCTPPTVRALRAGRRINENQATKTGGSCWKICARERFAPAAVLGIV